MENSSIPAFTLSRRIGSTNYRVNAHFSDTEVETLEDKIFRMIQNEVLENGSDCGTMKSPTNEPSSLKGASHDDRQADERIIPNALLERLYRDYRKSEV